MLTIALGLLAAPVAPQGTTAGDGRLLELQNPSEVTASGTSVAIDGDLVLTGAPKSDLGAHASADLGAAFLFEWDGAGWNQIARLVDDPFLAGPRGRVGNSVAIDGDLIVLGASNAGFSTGLVLVFERDAQGVWQLVQRITPPESISGDRFGYAVDTDGTRIVAASTNDIDAPSGAGAVYVYVRGPGGWAREQKLVASDVAPDDFTSACSIDGDAIVIGAWRASAPANRSGAAYVHRLGPTGWVEEQKLVGSNSDEEDAFGFSVDIRANRIAVGAPDAGPGTTSSAKSGAAYLFELAAPGQWVETGRLDASGVDRDLGSSVALGRDLVVVGDTHLGEAYIYDLVGSAWVLSDGFSAVAPWSGAHFGASVAVDDARIAVGAPGGSTSTGATFAYPLVETFARYCDPAVPTTAGTPASLDAVGSSFLVDDWLELHCAGMPAGVFGYFVGGDQVSFVPNAGGSHGDLCLGGTVLRFDQPVLLSDPTGAFMTPLDLQNVPVVGQFAVGETWQFQSWFRDGSSSNFSNAVTVTFR